MPDASLTDARRAAALPTGACLTTVPATTTAPTAPTVAARAAGLDGSARMNGVIKPALLVAMIMPFAAAPATARAGGPDPASPEFFETRIRPVLVGKCYSCHSAEAPKVLGGLRVDGHEVLIKGGDSGPAIEPGAPEKSNLIRAVGYADVDLQMPPKGKLPDAAIADLTAWVKAGAPWPATSVAKTGTTAPAGPPAFDIKARKEAHWAWHALRSDPAPAVKNAAWARSDTDRFILAKLEAAGLAPAAPADRRTLIRRASFAVTGLPPTAEEIEAFVADKSPDAWEKVVDRLLASPAFGERWGRHWLDLVRYAETRGHEFDFLIPNAWQYRDYVIRAFNADVPYDRLLVEHVAGDLSAKPRTNPADGANESVLGTGFWFLGEEVHSPVDIRGDQADRLDNRIDVLTKTFLGMTVSCARCHDHKFDAISTKDFYSLFSVLESSSYRQVRFDAPGRNEAVAAKLAEVRAKARADVGKALSGAASPVAGKAAVYLLAAREALPSLDADRGQIAELARDRGLDEGLVRAWAVHLRDAAKDRRHLLHAFALAASGPATKTKPGKSAPRPAAPVGNPAGVETVVDYGAARPDDWMPDDVGFGAAPARVGDVRFASDARNPGIRFVDAPAAEWDRFWDLLKPARGTERESGALGRYEKFGRSLRTPTFTVGAGPVQMLVRGPVHVYAGVSQHIMINGPLHGSLSKSFPTAKGDDGWRWVRMDLTPYRGLRAHLELTPYEGADLAVAKVVQGDGALPIPVPADPTVPVDGGDGKPADGVDPARAAKAFAARLKAALAAAAADKSDGKDAATDARLAGWVAGNPDLFGADTRKVLDAALAPHIAAQAALAKEALAESRLAPAMWEGTGVDGRVFIRGGHKALGEPAPRRFLEALAGPTPLAVPRGSGRLQLAAQMTDPAVNPLFPRVMVNRVWHHLFGRGIVASTDNFGILGERPSHPELLDHLAVGFAKDGWSVKRLIRRLMLTSAYAMSSRAEPAIAAKAAEVDGANLLLWKFRIHRLEGEAIRDAVLAVSGRLDRRMSGAPVPVHLTSFVDGRGKPASGPVDGAGRRSIYISVRRNFLSPMMLAFDTPIPFSTVGRRTSSNVPAQSLILLNDPFVHGQAELWGGKLARQAGSVRDRITAMTLAVFARPATEAELAAMEGYVAGRETDPAAWSGLAHALFNVKEFVYIP